MRGAGERLRAGERLSGFFEKTREGRQRHFRNVMFKPFGIGFRRFRWNADGHQNVHDKPVACAHPPGQIMPGLGEKYAALGF